MKKFLRYSYFMTCFVVMLAFPVHAYLDPSVMTYAIQIVAGLAVAIGAVVGVYWRKAKKLLSEKLGIDENANKELEDNIVFFGDEPLI